MGIKETETIAAISTPLGASGIGVIRLSGEDSITIADKVFRGKSRLSEAESYTAHYGFFTDPETGEAIDEVICLVMKAPRSYTMEDMVEISAHGSVLLLKYLLEKIFLSGARPAEPGEFTKRAFLNGRIDLTQAEAISDIINARTMPGFRNAFRQLRGGINKRIKKIRKKLIDYLALLEAEIDFPEEGNVYYDKTEIITSMNKIAGEIKKLIGSYEEGRVIKEGIKIAICGKPNVGKSSVLNRLIEKDKAIVSPEPGTTRDLIEAEMKLGGILFQLVDTAGIRKAGSVVEEEGIRRTGKAIKESDFVIVVIDSEDVKDKSISSLIRYVEKNMKRFSDNEQRKGKIIVVLNKIDLLKSGKNKISEDENIIKISAKTGKGISTLKAVLMDKISCFEELHTEEVYLSNLRQKSLLEKSSACLKKAVNDLSENLSEEYVVINLRESIDHLNELTGESLKEEWLDVIFSKFCIGK